ncbi:hypothetical protein HK097_007044 [Rhizophlyctis rosea]|uniref:Uncharacterized protein n=1 Tax=Rhizophlyctis rosea TaxID=64517 RepID=A0AAD5SE05_9FUNG|nr:hypothetical protein HK097_007044 [Rhizophlyctis rosea]
MNTVKVFHGDRAERFRTLPPVTGEIGPGAYNVDEATNVVREIMSKPTSRLGVAVTTAIRFPALHLQSPSNYSYQPKGFLDELNVRPSSRRGLLSSLGPKSVGDSAIRLKELRAMTNMPTPGTYDVNYAIGRQVATDHRFALLKSDKLKMRDKRNAEQLTELRKLLGANDLFTDKRACRRMAHLALYHP